MLKCCIQNSLLCLLVECIHLLVLLSVLLIIALPRVIRLKHAEVSLRQALIAVIMSVSSLMILIYLLTFGSSIEH
jgi:hypothetical protein